MQHQSKRNRRAASLANLQRANEARACKSAQAESALQQQRDALADGIARYLDGGMPLATIQAQAQAGEAIASAALSALERLYGEQRAGMAQVLACMREDNSGPYSVSLTWPERITPAPDQWSRAISAPQNGIARLAWREQVVRHGARAAAQWCEARGIAWRDGTPAESSASSVSSQRAAAVLDTAESLREA